MSRCPAMTTQPTVDGTACRSWVASVARALKRMTVKDVQGDLVDGAAWVTVEQTAQPASAEMEGQQATSGRRSRTERPHFWSDVSGRGQALATTRARQEGTP